MTPVFKAAEPAQLRKMMNAYQGAQHVAVAMCLHNGDRQVIGTGHNETGVAWGDLVFEIGSITKIFTAILLCVLIEEGKVDPRAPLSEMSGDLSDVPSWITPASLTSHTSGLPRIHKPIWKLLLKPPPEDPYADFTRSDLLAWLRNWSGKAPRPKPRHAYSNLGVGLLGEAMALAEGQPFEDLLQEKVLRPLGLTDTTARLDDDQQGRFLQPRNIKGGAVVPWTFRAMAAAGCLRSTVSDLTRFSAAVLNALGAPETVLDRAISRSVTPLFGLSFRGRIEPASQCFGWLSMQFNNTGLRILSHEGATAGSACALYICPERSAAIALLSNNGVRADIWASIKLSWSKPLRQAHDLFASL